MPVRNAQICKAILDGGARVSAGANAADTILKAVGANILEGTVADTSKGEAWTKEVLAVYETAAVTFEKLADRAKELCATQPVP